MGGAELDDHERDQAGHARSARAEDLGRGPPGIGGLGEREDDRPEAGRGERGAAKVESAPARVGCVGSDEPPRGNREAETDGDVDQEDRLPADELGQRSAQQDSDRGAGPADGAPGGKSVSTRGALAEGAHQDGESGRREHRRPESLECPSDEQRAGAAGRRGGDRGQREDRQPAHEHAALTDEVGGTTTEQQQASEDQRVARDRPADVAALDAQALSQIGQRNIDCGDVEDDHQLSGAEHQQQLLHAAYGAGAFGRFLGLRRSVVRGVLGVEVWHVSTLLVLARLDIGAAP